MADTQEKSTFNVRQDAQQARDNRDQQQSETEENTLADNSAVRARQRRAVAESRREQDASDRRGEVI